MGWRECDGRPGGLAATNQKTNLPFRRSDNYERTCPFPVVGTHNLPAPMSLSSSLYLYQNQPWQYGIALSVSAPRFIRRGPRFHCSLSGLCPPSSAASQSYPARPRAAWLMGSVGRVGSARLIGFHPLITLFRDLTT